MYIIYLKYIQKVWMSRIKLEKHNTIALVNLFTNSMTELSGITKMFIPD